MPRGRFRRRGCGSPELPGLGSACRALPARLLESLAVVSFRDNLDQCGRFLAVEAFAAKLAETPLERLGVLWSEERDLRGHHLPGDRILFGAYGRIPHVVQLEQNVLELVRVQRLAGNLDHLCLASRTLGE